MKEGYVPYPGGGILPGPTPHSILEQLWRNDRNGWDRFALVYLPFVFRRVCKHGMPKADAEDLTHEVFLKISKSIHGFRKEKASSSFRSWICTVVRTTVIDFCREHGRQPVLLETSEFEDGTTSEADSETGVRDDDLKYRAMMQSLEEVKKKVGEKNWRLFELNFLEGIPATEVAQQMGVRLNRVHLAKHRVLKTLERITRKRFPELFGEEPAAGV